MLFDVNYSIPFGNSLLFYIGKAFALELLTFLVCVKGQHCFIRKKYTLQHSFQIFCDIHEDFLYLILIRELKNAFKMI